MRVQLWINTIKWFQIGLYKCIMIQDVLTIKLKKYSSDCQLNPTRILSIRELLFNI